MYFDPSKLGVYVRIRVFKSDRMRDQCCQWQMQFCPCECDEKKYRHKIRMYMTNRFATMQGITRFEYEFSIIIINQSRVLGRVSVKVYVYMIHQNGEP